MHKSSLLFLDLSTEDRRKEQEEVLIMAARTRAVVAVIFITILVMLSAYSDAVQPLMDFEGRKISSIRGTHQQKQRRVEMRKGQEEAAAEPMRRQEQAPSPPIANSNFPGPDPSPSSKNN